MKNIFAFLFCALSLSVSARSYSLKLIGSDGKALSKYFCFQDKSKRLVAELTIGRQGPKDDITPLEIRAASVFKEITEKVAFVNDIAIESFEPTNTVTKKVYIVSGAAFKRVDNDAKVNGGDDFSRGYTVAGFIVEIWQGDKCVKHLSNLPGKDGKTPLALDIKCAYIKSDGYNGDEFDFDNKTQIKIEGEK